MPYFTTADLRRLPDLESEQRFPEARLQAARDWIEGVVERECDTSFIPRTRTERLSGDSTGSLFLAAPYVLSIESITVDGVALTTPQLEALVTEHGIVHRPTGYTWANTARGNIEVTYTSGYSTTPPADLKEAMLRGARHWLLTMDGWSGVDERSLSISNDYGNITLSAPGDGRPTGLPTVDATIMAWARKVRLPRFA